MARRLTLAKKGSTCLFIRTVDVHLLVVRDGRRRSELTPNRDDVIDDDPAVIPSCEDSVHIFRPNVRNVVERGP